MRTFVQQYSQVLTPPGLALESSPLSSSLYPRSRTLVMGDTGVALHLVLFLGAVYLIRWRTHPVRLLPLQSSPELI